MRTVQLGDRVQVHYRIRAQDGSSASSRGRAPLCVVAGTAHRRVPGLDKALLGLAPGATSTWTLPATEAFGAHDPARLRRWPRTRLSAHANLKVGLLLRFADARGRRRLIRIVELGRDQVVVDTNHRWAGQSVQIEIELIAIDGAQDAGSGRALPGTKR